MRLVLVAVVWWPSSGVRKFVPRWAQRPCVQQYYFWLFSIVVAILVVVAVAIIVFAVVVAMILVAVSLITAVAIVVVVVVWVLIPTSMLLVVSTVIGVTSTIIDGHRLHILHHGLNLLKHLLLGSIRGSNGVFHLGVEIRRRRRCMIFFRWYHLWFCWDRNSILQLCHDVTDHIGMVHTGVLGR